MLFRYGVSLFLAIALFLAETIPAAAAETGVVDIEAGPIWSNDHARERCPEVAREWTAENPGSRAVWTGHWRTTVPGEMSVCVCEIAADEDEPAIEIEAGGVVEVGGDLRTRRGYFHAWINEAEDVSILYFVFDNGVLQCYRDEPDMGHVFNIDLSGLPDAKDMAGKIIFEDIDGDGYADMKIPLPDGRFAAWRWNAGDGTFETTASGAPLPAPASTRKTLAALPVWTTPRVIVHAGEMSAIASRLGNSWLLDCALDIRPERKDLLEWLRSFPVESFSLVGGMSDDEEDTFQGAIRFGGEKDDILARLEELPLPAGDDGHEAKAELSLLFYQLSGVPRSLASDDGVLIRASFVEGRRNLYVVSGVSNLFGQWLTIHDVFVSVADSDGDKLLLAASSPEEIERARNALADESARLEIVRRAPEKPSFVQIVDDAAGSETRDMVYDMYWDFQPKASAGLELSLGLSDDGFDLSLWHTFFDVVFGDSFRPRGGWRAEDAGFAFGGGHPWLAGALSPALTEKEFGDLLIFSADGDGEQVRDMLERIGSDLAALSGAFRSIGLVLGGNASMHGEWMPGGYVFTSGDAEKMRTLAPVVNFVLNSRLSHSFQAVDREGWDVFYVLNDEYRERTAGMPWYAGMKDGVLMLGVLAEDDLESAPEIDWPDSDGDKAILLGGVLDFDCLVAQCRMLFETLPLHRAYEAASAMDMEELFTPKVWSGAFKFFAAAQEIDSIALAVPDANRLELTVRTDSVDYETVWELMRISRMLARED